MAVMPCFDKKLEASRSDFYMNKAETREVDCVITSGTVAYPYATALFVRNVGVSSFIPLTVAYRRGSENA